MYETATKQLNSTSDQQYFQLSNGVKKRCQFCKKVSERKKKIRGDANESSSNPINSIINSTSTLITSLLPPTNACHIMLAHPALLPPTFQNPAAENHADNQHSIKTQADVASSRQHHSSCLTIRRLFCTLILCCALFSVAEGCGPGRGIGGPRRHRKLTPLVFKQHVPNMSERTLGASGLNEGAIKRDSPKFKNLVPNYNRDIIFKDDEGTGADRLMSRRCKEKLNILAVSVMNQWPGVRLRVTESWDEDNAHHTDSLHYEGRAVDITTSDRDRTKYGMLARLAVEAGFDWVYYESRAHIHCSVKSDSKHIPHVSGCFSADSSVLLADGQRKSLSDLNIGDRVLAMSATGQPIYSEVILFMDRNLEQMENFVRIHTDDDNENATLTVTAAHLVLIWHPIERRTEYMFADRVQEDDYVFVHDRYGRLSPRRVRRIEVVRKSGVVAPLTREGTIVVNSVTASCYAVVNSQTLAHWGLAPMRLMASIRAWLPGGGDSGNEVVPQTTAAATKGVEESQRTKFLSAAVALNATAISTSSRAATTQIKGIHWYAQFLNTLKDIVLPQGWIYQ